jgi:predicted amidohydrolase
MGFIMTDESKVALGQMSSRWAEKEINLRRIKAMTAQAAAEGADLIVFPEMALTGYRANASFAEMRTLAEPVPGPATQALAAVAQAEDIGIAFGLPEVSGEDLYDTAVLLTGDDLRVYRKTHAHWTEYFTPGDALPVWSTTFGQVGMLICFDLSFSEPARVLALGGAELILAPSAVPPDFDAHAQRRAAARALDNQLYVLYCNFAGPGFPGHSLVADPEGELVALASGEETLLFCSVNRERLRAWREKERVFAMRHPELYTPISRRQHNVQRRGEERTQKDLR